MKLVVAPLFDQMTSKLLLILLISIRPSHIAHTHKAQLVPRSYETLVPTTLRVIASASSSGAPLPLSNHTTSRVILSLHITTENSMFLMEITFFQYAKLEHNLHSFKKKFISSLWRQKSNPEAPQYSHTDHIDNNGEFFPSLESETKRNETNNIPNI